MTNKKRLRKTRGYENQTEERKRKTQKNTYSVASLQEDLCYEATN